MATHLNVLVTGASSGIGRAVAVELAGRGHTVFAAARREAALEELAATHPGIAAAPMDVTDEDSIARAFKLIDSTTDGTGVDVLVNAAGFALTGPIETLSIQEVKRQFDTNVFGLLAVTRAALPSMRARRAGRLINISSVVGRTSFPAMGVYGATKYAVEALSDALRMELAPAGIKVVLIEPGFVATDIVGASMRERDGAASPATESQDAYAPLIGGAEKFLDKQMKRAMPAAALARTIADAAEAHRPRTRYLAPLSAKGLVAVFTRLPDRIADAAKLRAITGAA
ncbi:MAG TPA: SDR family oxidoreductase [Mycobacterium sp.]|nr:SDR family oxidoreductase [Mycobacterium sp.]